MDIIETIRNKARSQLKNIILPEADDERVREAFNFIVQEKIANVTLVGKNDLDKTLLDEFAREFFELRKHKGLGEDEARETVKDPLYYAAMLTRRGLADGFVAGASASSSKVIKAALNCIGPDKAVGTVSSCFIMQVPECNYGENGLFLFADCGVIPSPSPRQLANIAISTSNMAKKLFNFTPKVAILSYSTKGSAEGELVDNVRKAVELARSDRPDLIIDGELQVDSALVREVAEKKSKTAIIKGDANILIFPGLEAGNIGYKLVQRLAKARAIGPILTGLNKPCSDLSRGCVVDDVIDCVAVTSILAQK